MTETQIEPKPSAVAPGTVQHKESFEVVHADGRIEFVYYDENPGRRAINGRLSKQAAFCQGAGDFAGLKPRGKIQQESRVAWPKPKAETQNRR